MEERKFYDIHCHAMNLSHPNFLAFLNRFESSVRTQGIKVFLGTNLLMAAYFILNPLCPKLLEVILKKTGIEGAVFRVKNLLALMENDLGAFFQFVEECLHEHIFTSGQLSIGSFTYNKLVLTPLIMDFGYKNMTNPSLHYFRKPIQKPVVEQVIDIFNGIKQFYSPESVGRILEIYPFLGINTANYSQEQISMMLEKYFSSYRGEESDLFTKLGKFDGDIEQMRSNFFAGIKVYPPLGFDPWPSNQSELKKAESLYYYCEEKGIPITSHCSDGGFRVVDLKSAWEFTSPARWEKVLQKYSGLKLNLAHFGNGRFSKKWSDKIVSLIEQYDQVYADFSCRGFDDDFYLSLHNLLHKGNDKTRERLMERVLFGSDFMINLLWMDSYCQYLKIFCDTPHFLAEEKDAFCCLNPKRFLFGTNLPKTQPKMVQ